MKKSLIEFYTRLAHGLAVQFGSNCEVVVHDLQGKDIEHSIIAIENGHVTGRRIGDGPSQIVLESLHNYDISLMLAMEKELSSFTGTIEEDTTKEPIAVNIGDLLDELISQSVQHIGKPVTLMTKEDKVQVVRLLNEAGAFLITKSGPKVCQFLGISKYTLYSYLDEIKSKNTI